MRQKLNKCLFALAEEERTLPIILGRFDEIRSQLNRFAGIMKQLTPEVLERNTEYQSRKIIGWSDYIKQLSNELLVIKCELVKRLP